MRAVCNPCFTLSWLFSNYNDFGPHTPQLLWIISLKVSTEVKCVSTKFTSVCVIVGKREWKLYLMRKRAISKSCQLRFSRRDRTPISHLFLKDLSRHSLLQQPYYRESHRKHITCAHITKKKTDVVLPSNLWRWWRQFLGDYFALYPRRP